MLFIVAAWTSDGKLKQNFAKVLPYRNRCKLGYFLVPIWMIITSDIFHALSIKAPGLQR